eukprot:gene10572-66301_t
MALIAEWQAAKKAKDYRTSDRIRDELKEKCFKCGGGKPATTEQIQWKAAKAARDYALSDQLRAKLQERGHCGKA